MATNLQLATKLAEFADGLAQYNHLPPLAFAVVDINGLIRTQPALSSLGVAAGEPRLAAVGAWANAFATPVLLDLTDMATDTVRVSTEVQIAGRRVLVHVALLKRQFLMLAKWIGLGQFNPGEQINVTAEQLLSAVRNGAAA